MSSCTVKHVDVVVGAGISGLVCAAALHAQHHSVVVLEARARVGGRLLSPRGVDLGASWSWPPHDRRVGALARSLGIMPLDQHLDGEAFASVGGARAQSVGNAGSEMAPCGPGAVRFRCGYQALPRALAASLPGNSIRTGCRVESVSESSSEGNGGIVEIAYQPSGGGEAQRLTARRVVLALPPGVGAATIRLEPPLPEQQRSMMAATATWCGDWCKVVASFRTPFWRASGASGVVASDGPIQIWWEGAGGSETQEVCAALIGLGVGEACAPLAPLQVSDSTVEGENEALSPEASSGIPAETPVALKALVLASLGPAYGTAVIEEQLTHAWVKTWIADDLTFASAGRHREYGHPLLQQATPWGVHFAGTETEPENGHVEGAIAAGERAAKEVIESLGVGVADG